MTPICKITPKHYKDGLNTFNHFPRGNIPLLVAHMWQQHAKGEVMSKLGTLQVVIPPVGNCALSTKSMVYSLYCVAQKG